MKKSSPQQLLSDAAAEAVHSIAAAAELAKATIANAAAEAVKVTSSRNVDGVVDHDILIELKTKMDDLKDDIKDLKDGTSTQIAQHEIAIKKNTLDIQITKTQLKTWGIAISVFWAVLTLIVHYLK